MFEAGSMLNSVACNVDPDCITHICTVKQNKDSQTEPSSNAMDLQHLMLHTIDSSLVPANAGCFTSMHNKNSRSTPPSESAGTLPHTGQHSTQP